MKRLPLQPHPLAPRSAGVSPSAFTLIELIVAMSIVSILMLAITSALSFSLKVSSGQGAIDQTNLLSAADAADQITDDIHVATSFTERTATSMTFAVPDRVSAGTPNQIRYAWDGTSGHSLTRQFSSSATATAALSTSTYTPVALLTGVTNFNLQYLTRQMGSPAATDSALLSPSNTLLGSNQNSNIDTNHWCSQCVTLSLPFGTSTYTITRIQACIQDSGPQDGILRMRVCSASGNAPGALLQEQPMYESSFSTAYEYVEVKFTNLTGLPANQPICVVIGGSANPGPAGTVQYQSALLSILSGAYWSTSTNGGSTWSLPVSTNNLRMYIYGTVP